MGGDKNVLFQRSAMALLNKLAPDNSETIATQMVAEVEKLNEAPAGSEATAQLRNVAAMLLKRAAKEGRYRQLYADLCVALGPGEGEAAAEGEEKVDEAKNFTALLLANLDTAIEEILDGKVDAANLQADPFVAHDVRLELVGTVMLHGLLMARGIVEPAAFDRMVKRLLAKAAVVRGAGEQPHFAEALTEATIQSVRVLGPFLENSEDPVLKDLLMFSMAAFAELARTASRRIRFMVLDIQEDREKGWPQATPGSTKSFYGQPVAAPTKSAVKAEHDKTYVNWKEQRQAYLRTRAGLEPKKKLYE